jgi:multiple sugar transport system ATP-binding protein
MELAFDTSKIAIFDSDTGVNLTIEPTGSQDPTPAPVPASEPPAAPALARQSEPSRSSDQTPPPAE